MGVTSKRDMFSSAKILFSFSLLASAINFLASFILAYLYKPEDFGLFVLFFSLANLLSGFLFLRADFQIVKYKERELYAYSLLVYSTILLIVCVFILSVFFLNLLYIIVIIIWAFLISLSSLVTYLAINRERNDIIAFVRLSNAVAITFLQLTISFVSNKGLIFGSAIGCGLVHIVALFYFARNVTELLELKEVIITLKLNYKSSFWSTLSWCGDALLISFLPLLITHFYGVTLAGYFAFADRIIKSPISVVGSTLSPLFIRYLGETDDKKQIKYTLLRSLQIFLILSILACILSYSFLSNIVIFLWGDKWAVSASIIFFVTIYYISYLYNISTVYFYHHFGIANYYLYQQILYFFTVFILFINIEDGLLAIKISLAMYCIYFIFNVIFQHVYLMRNSCD